jgi:hypothetical protein
MRRFSSSSGFGWDLGKLLADPRSVVLKGGRTPVTPCPYCGAPNNMASSENGTPPNPGDYCICLECTGLCAYDDQLELAKLQLEDIADPDERSAVARTIEQAKHAAHAIVFKAGHS